MITVSVIMYCILSCGVFKKELEAVEDQLGFPFEVRYLEAGLHVSFDDLGDALRAELEKCSDYEGIIVLYGACHPKIDQILAPCRAVLIDCQNCIDALVTRKEVENISKRGLYFYLTPGWLDCWRDVFSRLGWNAEDARRQMGCFRGVIFLDTLKNADQYQEELMQFFDYTLLSYEVMPVDLDHFKSLIMDAKKKLEM
jgi:hypothetical protein